MSPTDSRPRTYICLGTAWKVGLEFAELANRGGAYPWKIHQSARRRDRVIVYRHGTGWSVFVGQGRIVANPAMDRQGNLLARVGDLNALPKPIPIATAKSAFPQWSYLNAPRRSTQVPPEIADDFIAFLNGGSPSTDVDQEFFEGEPRLKEHVHRERNRAVIQAKRAEVLAATGELRCEACGFSFEEKYGTLGKGFCEVHHRTPLSKASGRRPVKTSELHVICSNCHRMIHRSRPMMPVSALRKLGR